MSGAESSAFADLAELPPHRIWDGVLGRSLHTERVTLALIELEPGAVVPEHHHPQEQVGLLLQGAMIFSIAGETRTLGPGGTWRIPADVPHAVTAGPHGAVAFEVFAPDRQNDWADHERFEPTAPRWPSQG